MWEWLVIIHYQHNYDFDIPKATADPFSFLCKGKGLAKGDKELTSYFLPGTHLFKVSITARSQDVYVNCTQEWKFSYIAIYTSSV